MLTRSGLEGTDRTFRNDIGAKIMTKAVLLSSSTALALLALPALTAAPCWAAPGQHEATQVAKPSQEDQLAAQLRQHLSQASRTHPRLFLDPSGVQALEKRIAKSTELGTAAEAIIAAADRVMSAEPATRTMTGRRLLHVSRLVLTRVTHLSLGYLLTGKPDYAERAAREMLAAAAFSDWNPSHFLDVAEMTAALAIGYDWCHDALDEATRTRIRQAIVEHGLRPSLKGGWWVRTTNNWNQVCHGGLSLGALAIHEHHAELAARILTRAVRNLPRAMHEYAPDGAYPEGPGYWRYGTTYNVIALAALRSALGTDFGLSKQPGFLESSTYYLHMTGPTGLFFNYSDCGSRGGVSAAMYWFARERGDTSLLWRERELLRSKLARFKSSGKAGLGELPFVLLWAPPLNQVEEPSQLSFSAQGPTPVAAIRSGWSKNASYIAIKGGSPSANHAHMDVGSFVIDALGTRWASDLGMQSYHSLESKGIRLWGRDQKAQRWTVFRLSTYAHNVPVVDGKQQRVKGHARLSFDPKLSVASVDLSPVYAGQLKSAQRRAQLLPDGSIVILDKLEAPADRNVSARWALLTRAEIEIQEDGVALLKRDGKRMLFRVEAIDAPRAVQLRIYDTAKPRKAYDYPNPGTRMLGFEITLPATQSQALRITLSPRAK
jgi:hypothetical protein